MSTLSGRLGELYGLSPATVAGLANVTGAPSSAPPTGPPPADGPQPGELDTGGEMPGSVAASGPGAADDKPKPTYGVDSRGYLITEPPTAGDAPSAPGPAADDFPTVRNAMAQPGAGVAPAVAPGVTVPAHWQPGSHAVSLQRGMAPEELERGQYDRDVAMGHELAANDQHLRAAQERGMADAIYSAAHAQAAKIANDRIAQLNQDKDRYVAGEQKKLDTLRAAAKKEVNPDAFFKERGDGARLAAALMIGLNQFAVLWRGRGTNTAMEIINKGIDDNIKAQEANIANANRALDREDSLYARNLATFGDKERAILATKVQYLDHVAALADGQRAQAGQTDAGAGHDEFVAKVYQQAADHADQFAKLTHTQATEQMNEHFVPRQTVGGGAGEKGKDALYVPTLGGYARDAESARLLNSKGALRMQIGENMHKIDKLMEESKGLSSFSIDGYQRLKQIDEQIHTYTNRILTAQTVLAGQGAMSKGDMAVSEEAAALQDATVQGKMDFNIERRRQNLRRAAETMLTDHRLEGEAYGIQKGTERYAAGPNGPTPVRALQGRNAAPSKITQGVSDLVREPKGDDR